MQMETIWAQEVMPVLADFRSMQYLDRTPPPEGSRWRFNYTIPDVDRGLSF